MVLHCHQCRMPVPVQRNFASQAVQQAAPVYSAPAFAGHPAAMLLHQQQQHAALQQLMSGAGPAGLPHGAALQQYLAAQQLHAQQQAAQQQLRQHGAVDGFRHPHAAIYNDGPAAHVSVMPRNQYIIDMRLRTNDQQTNLRHLTPQ